MLFTDQLAARLADVSYAGRRMSPAEARVYAQFLQPVLADRVLVAELWAASQQGRAGTGAVH